MIALLGGTSQVGYFLLRRLTALHYPVLAISRNNPPAWGIGRDVCWMQADLDQSPMPSDASYLLAAGALRHAAAAVAVMPRLKHVVAISSSSVVTKQSSVNADEQQVVSELRQAEARLQEQCDNRGITLTILRPTLIYGCGLDKNLSRIAHWLRRRSWLPLARPAAGRRQPVHADDLAALCIRCLEQGETGAGCFAVGGGTVLSYREMVECVAQAVERPLRVFAVPAWLLAPVLDLLGRSGPLAGLNGAMIRRQNVDLVVDDSAARQRLGWQPRPFLPDAACFTPPGQH